MTVPISIPNLTLPDIRPPNFAKYAVEAIYDEIARFESDLDESNEVGLCVVGGPAGLTVHVREIYRYGSDKLVFVGIDGNSNPVRLIQHLNQLNVLLVSVPKMSDEPFRMGFHSSGKAEGG